MHAAGRALARAAAPGRRFPSLIVQRGHGTVDETVMLRHLFEGLPIVVSQSTERASVAKEVRRCQSIAAAGAAAAAAHRFLPRSSRLPQWGGALAARCELPPQQASVWILEQARPPQPGCEEEQAGERVARREVDRAWPRLSPGRRERASGLRRYPAIPSSDHQFSTTAVPPAAVPAVQPSGAAGAAGRWAAAPAAGARPGDCDGQRAAGGRAGGLYHCPLPLALLPAHGLCHPLVLGA